MKNRCRSRTLEFPDTTIARDMVPCINYPLMHPSRFKTSSFIRTVVSYLVHFTNLTRAHHTLIRMCHKLDNSSQTMTLSASIP